MYVTEAAGSVPNENEVNEEKVVQIFTVSRLTLNEQMLSSAAWMQ